MPETSENGATGSQLEKKFVTLQGWQTVGRVQTYATALIIAGLFGNFAYRTYHDVVGGFTPERTQRAVETALPTIAPAAGKVLKDVVAEVLPEVRKQAADRYATVKDKLTASATEKFEAVPEQAGDLLSQSIERAFERAVARVGPEVEQFFPTLSTPEGRAQLALYVHEVIEARNKELAHKFEALAVTEGSRVHGILEKFDGSLTADARSDEELQEDLVRTLLKLAEQEMESRSQFSPSRAARSTASNDGY